jgi:hypothetical protein
VGTNEGVRLISVSHEEPLREEQEQQKGGGEEETISICDRQVQKVYQDAADGGDVRVWEGDADEPRRRRVSAHDAVIRSQLGVLEVVVWIRGQDVPTGVGKKGV